MPAVAELMTAGVRTVRDTTPLVEVERRLDRWRISCVAVVDKLERPVGAISRFDLLRVGRLRSRTSRGEVLVDLPDLPARKVMRPGVISVRMEATVREAATILVEHRIHRVFVTEGDHLVGVFSTRDAMRAVLAAKIDVPLSAFASSPLCTASTTEAVSTASDRLAQERVTGLVVVEERWPVGLFGQIEALAARDLPPATPVEQAMSYALLCMPVGAPLYRAAGAAAVTRARRVLTIVGREAVGILTGLDFARALLA